MDEDHDGTPLAGPGRGEDVQREAVLGLDFERGGNSQFRVAGVRIWSLNAGGGVYLRRANALPRNRRRRWREPPRTDGGRSERDAEERLAVRALEALDRTRRGGDEGTHR